MMYPFPVVLFTSLSAVGLFFALKNLKRALAAKALGITDLAFVTIVHGKVVNESLRAIAHGIFILVGVVAMFVPAAFFADHPGWERVLADTLGNAFILVPGLLALASYWTGHIDNELLKLEKGSEE